MVLPLRHSACLVLWTLAFGRFGFAQTPNRATPPTIALFVDATEAPRKIFHARLSAPVNQGTNTFYFPQWIPGEHGPTGPIADLAGLRFTANGQALKWRRDLVEVYAFNVEVPPGPATIDIALDFLSPAGGQFSAGASATEKLAIVSWNTLLLYPKGWTTDQITYRPSLKLPAGWKFGTALDIVKEGETIDFAAVSLTTLVDSPVLTGQYLRKVDLGGDLKHTLNIAADSASALEAKPETIQSFKNLVAETGALFGARHYRHYDFLLTLSDHTAHFGLEHHESSDDRVAESALTDDDAAIATAGLLPHEMTHSWNGKYRRPAGLATPDFRQPMKDDLLWVYEGLTQYWGNVLTARSGELSAEMSRDRLAGVAAYLDHWPGRTWRPLQDTADDAQVLYNAATAWASWRRGVDFYDESVLIWLEADTIIRRETRGAKSLDDFSRIFHGGQTAPPRIVSYTFDDVVTTLNAVAEYDWRGLLRARLDSLAPRAPLAGLESSGWKLVYTDQIGAYQRARERTLKFTDEWYSLGVSLDGNGSISDIVKGMAADTTGLGPGMKIVAVNGRTYSSEVLRNAIGAAKGTSAPLELIVQNGEYYRTVRLDYHDGLKFAHLERDPARPDLLSDILKPHAK